MKISVIVPVYNSEKYIHKLVDSVVNQTYKDYELIMVDDGSKDKSFEIMKKLKGDNEKIKIFSKGNTGPGFTRKYGYEQSTGDLLFFVDSDDWITDNYVFEKIVNIFNDNDIDILFFDREDIQGNYTDTIKGFDNMEPGWYSINDLKDIVRPGLGAKILKRQLLKNDMFIEAKKYEDLYTTYLYLDKCNNFAYINEKFYTIFHEENANTLSNITGDEVFEKSLKLVVDLYGKLERKNVKISLAKRLTGLLMEYWKFIIKRKELNYNVKLYITKLVDILYENKITLDKSNYNIIKRMIFSMLLKIHRKRIKIV